MSDIPAFRLLEFGFSSWPITQQNDGYIVAVASSNVEQRQMVKLYELTLQITCILSFFFFFSVLISSITTESEQDRDCGECSNIYVEAEFDLIWVWRMH